MFGTEYHREEIQVTVSLQPADTCVGNTKNENGTACDVERKLVHPRGYDPEWICAHTQKQSDKHTHMLVLRAHTHTHAHIQ